MISTTVTGAVDVGTLAYLLCAFTAVFTVFPVYCRDKVIEREEVALYPDSVSVIFILLVFGLKIFPSPKFIPADSRVNGILLLYICLGTFVTFTGAVYHYRMKENEPKGNSGNGGDSDSAVDGSGDRDSSGLPEVDGKKDSRFKPRY
ncbi:hypothetical protein [Halorussus sp. MSC15.2]|uniref:hypothetical protein n=1 Tax=Halorussus sp. MSC15.2 TaxID=2283638 RepID=UPI0013D00F79|nr:hypothetical protein [Halorussus sp. MSC15.2]NEU58781.1 hypothetical protein [Halorussus sp. MSC15.2]